MKKIILFAILFVISIVCSIYLIYKINVYKEQLSIAESNNKALLYGNGELNTTNRELQLSIEQVKYCNDSISKALQDAISKLKVKDSKIKQLHYMLSTNFRVDTVSILDTIFIKDFHIDTLIKNDKWYSLNLQLRYPNKIITSPKFINEYIAVFKDRKETIRPPKKCFIARWFQKKHTIVEVFVTNNNPYSAIDTTKFIKIIR